MRKKWLQRGMALLCSIGIITGTMPLNAINAANPQEEELRKQLAALVDEEQYPNGRFEFLAPRIEVEEGMEYVEFAVVRTGNTDSKASVDFKVVDISATYNEDYKITVSGLLRQQTLSEDKDTVSMSEKIASEAEQTVLRLGDAASDEALKQAVDSKSLEETQATSNEDEGESMQEASKQAAAEESEEELDMSGDNLRSAYEIMTGHKANKTDWTERGINGEKGATKEELLEAYNNTYASMPGAKKTLSFDAGEYKKVLRFYVMDDKTGEDDEQVMLVLTNAVNGALSENPTGLVNIKDNDTYENSDFTFKEDGTKVSVDEDTAKLTVVRKHNTAHYAEVDITSASKTAECGEYYDAIAQTLTFSAGQTCQTVEIPILKHPTDKEVSFMVCLDNQDEAEVTLEAKQEKQTATLEEELTTNQTEQQVVSSVMEASDPWTARIANDDYCNGGEWYTKINDGVERATYLTDLDFSMVGKLEFYATNKSSGSYFCHGHWPFRKMGWNSCFTTFFMLGKEADKWHGDGAFGESYQSFILTDSERTATWIKAGARCWNGCYDTEASFKKIRTYYLPIKVRICDNGSASTRWNCEDYDSYLYTRTYTGVKAYKENQTKNTAKYIGGIKFNNGDFWKDNTKTTREQYYYGDDVVYLQEDYEGSQLSEQEKSNMYLWGFKIESKDMNNIGYYYVEGTSFPIKKLFTGDLDGYRVLSDGRKEYCKVNVGNVRMTDGAYYAFNIYPVYRQKTAMIKMSIDNDKCAFEEGTFKKDDVIAIGMLDTVKYTIAGKGSNIVKSYDVYAQNDYGVAVTSDKLERDIYRAMYGKNNKTADLGYAVFRFDLFSPYDSYCKSVRASEWPVRTTYTPAGVTKGELSITPATSFGFVKDLIHLVAQYETPSILMSVNPAATYAEAQNKAMVSYQDKDSGKEQTAVYTGLEDMEDYKKCKGTSIRVSPFFTGTTYDFRAFVTDADNYETVWTDMTGDTDKDGIINVAEKKALGKYADMISDQTFYGDVFSYTPQFMAEHQLYYWVRRKEPNTTGAKGRLSGYVYSNSRTVVENTSGKGGAKKALKGVQVVVNGQTVYTNEKGYYELKSTAFVPGSAYNITFNKDGQLRSAAAMVNRPMNDVVFDEYTTFDVKDFKAYTVKNTSGYVNVQKWTAQNIELDDIDNRDRRNLFTFKINRLSTEIVGNVEVKLYSENGTLKKTYPATFHDGCYIVNATQNQEGVTTNGYYSFNPATENVAAGDYLTIKVYDQNGIGYQEHKVGIKFRKYLSTINMVNSFKSPFNGVIEFIGQADAAFDLGLSAKLDNVAEDYITIKSTTDKETGEYTKTFSAGWDKSWKDSYDGNKSAEKKAKEEAKKNGADTPGTQAPTAAVDSEKSETAKKLVDTDSKDSKKTEKKSNLVAGYNFSLKVALSLSMKQDANSNRWYFEDFVVVATFAGASDFKYSYTTPIGVTIYITGGLSGDITGIINVERYGNNKQYFDGDGTQASPKIDLTSIGMSDVNRKLNFYGELQVNPSIKLGAGAGVGKVADVNVQGSADFSMAFRASGNGAGKVKLKGELSLTLLGGLIKKKWLLGQYQHNLFSYNGGSVQENASLNLFEKDTDFRYEKISGMDTADRSYLENQSEWLGDIGVRNRVAQLGANQLTEEPIIEGAYPYAYPVIQSMDNPDGTKDQIMVFLNDDGSNDDYNRSQLMYSIHHDGKWSKPEKVDNDSTNDDGPVMCYTADNQILIVWSSADEMMDASMDAVEMINARNIKARFFNTTDRTFGEVSSITKSTAADITSDDAPSISYTWRDGKEYLMVSYVKNEYSKHTGEDAVIGDVLNPYSVIAYRFYDFVSGKWVDSYTGEDAGKLEGMSEEEKKEYIGNWYGQGFVDLSTYVDVNDKKEIEVVPEDSQACITEHDAIGYNGMQLATYLLDKDGDKETLEDTDVVLQLYDFEKHMFYPAIRLTDDDMAQSCIELEENEAGGVSLFYISNGDIVEFDLTQLVDNGLFTKDQSEKDVVILNKDDLSYREPSVIHQAEENLPVTEYVAHCDGENMFLSWTEERITYKDGIDAGSVEALDADNTFVEHQIYLMMKSGEAFETKLYDENGEVCVYPDKDEEGNPIDYAANEDINGEIGTVHAGDEMILRDYDYSWSKPVMLTDEQGANYSDMDLAAAEPGLLRMAYLKNMSTVAEVDGEKMAVEDFDNCDFVSADYEINVYSYSLDFNDLSEVEAAKENVPVEVKVKNDAVVNGKNIKVSLYENEKLIQTQTIDKLKGGYDTTVTFLWNTPENMNGVTLSVQIEEDEDFSQKTEHTFEYEDDWTVEEVSAKQLKPDLLQITATVLNNGSQASTKQALEAEINGREVTSDAFEIGVGERKDISWDIPIQDSDFTSKEDEDGGITESASVAVYGRCNKVDADVVRYADSNLVKKAKDLIGLSLYNMDTGEKISDKISLHKNELLGIEYDVVSQAGLACSPKVSYHSNDESVVMVENGVLTGVGKGTASVDITIAPNTEEYLAGYGSALIRSFTETTLPSELRKTMTITVQVSEDELPPTSTEKIIPGDVTGDKKVTIEDAQIVLKAALCIMKLEGEKAKAADVNADKNVTLVDANMVLKAALGVLELKTKQEVAEVIPFHALKFPERYYLLPDKERIILEKKK